MVLEALLQRIDPNKYINELNRRKDLTWDIIQKYPTLPWPAGVISRLAPLTYIEQHQDQTWHSYEVSNRKDLNINFIRRHKDKLDWWVVFVNVDFQDFLNNPGLPWDYNSLSANRNVKSDDIISNPDLSWNYAELSKHIDLQFVYANPDLPWSYYILSRRVCLDFIRQNPHGNWDYYNLAMNTNMTIDFVLEYQDKNWCWNYLHNNPNITLEDLLTNNLQYKDFLSFQRRYPDYCLEHLSNLNWEIISLYASLDTIKKYPALPWNYPRLSMNKHITLDFVLEPREISWDYVALSKNPGISLGDVLDHWNLPWNIYNVIEHKY